MYLGSKVHLQYPEWQLQHNDKHFCIKLTYKYIILMLIRYNFVRLFCLYLYFQQYMEPT